MSKGSGSLCQIKDELKDAGDKVTFGLRMQLTGSGQTGDDTLEGNEESLTLFSDSVLINQLRHGTRSKGKMSEQRVPYAMREEGRDALADWYAGIIDESFFNQLTGNDSGETQRNGMNTVTAPSTNRQIIFDQNGTNHANESSIDASDTFQLELIDWALELAKTATPVIRPIRMNGKEYYVLFMHPFQVVDMVTNYGSGQWGDLQKAAMQGGEITDNPIFTGALGVYKNTIIHESTRIPNPTGSVRRAVLCGAQAASIAFGREYEDAPLFKWKEEYFDYENQLGIAACTVYGMKKNIYDDEDYGTVVLSTYGARHS